jgi:hypothetical protein
MKAVAKKPARKVKTAALPPVDYAVPAGKVLVLRTCLADMRSPSSDANGFIWPRSGPVECNDWQPTKTCGNGLHGVLWGEGDGGSPWVWDDTGVWLIVEVDASDVIELGGKVKFPRGVVVFSGPRLEATTMLGRLAPGRAIVGVTATAGDRGTATAGYRGTATAGDSGTATAGDRGTATAGDSGTATAGYGGTATAGDRGTATAGDSGTATAGDRGTATAGDSGTATAGDRGTATAGDRGTATAGDSGTATAGYGGTATAGDRGTATAGDSGTATAGDRGTATAGDRGTATAGYGGTATAGYGGTATAGDRGTATAGYSGTATAGDGGTATAGDSGEVRIRQWDSKAERYRTRVAWTGENGIKAGVAYRLNDAGEFVEAKS